MKLPAQVHKDLWQTVAVSQQKSTLRSTAAHTSTAKSSWRHYLPESQNCRVWKGPLEMGVQTSAQAACLQQVTEAGDQMCLDYLQRRLHTFSAQPVPELSQSHSVEVLY